MPFLKNAILQFLKYTQNCTSKSNNNQIIKIKFVFFVKVDTC